MNKLQIFSSGEFGKVRFVESDNKLYAVGIDVAKALEYAYPSQAISQHCKGIVKLAIPSGKGGTQQTNVITEGDIYRLIVKAADQSKNINIKMKAERFESWLFDEVLPALRHQGTYSVQPADNQSIPQLPQTYQEALRMLADKIDENQKLTPKAEKYDRFMSINSSQTVGQVAKALKIGRNRLFKLLKTRGYLMSDNTPYQKFINLGYFDVREAIAKVGCLEIGYSQTLVKPKGIDMIAELLGVNQLNTMEDIVRYIREHERAF